MDYLFSATGRRSWQVQKLPFYVLFNLLFTPIGLWVWMAYVVGLYVSILPTLQGIFTLWEDIVGIFLKSLTMQDRALKIPNSERIMIEKNIPHIVQQEIWMQNLTLWGVFFSNYHQTFHYLYEKLHCGEICKIISFG